MTLRLLAEDDLMLVRAWRNAPEVRRNMYSKHEISEAEHQAWFCRLKNDAQSCWLVHEDTDGQPDGVVYFTQLQPDKGSAFWGFYAGENARRGIGTRMEFDALEKAFYNFGLHKLNCEVLSSNGHVVNLHKKFGFKEEGLFRDFHFDGENYHNVVRLGILATEWATKRDEIQVRMAKMDGLAQTKVSSLGAGDF